MKEGYSKILEDVEASLNEIKFSEIETGILLSSYLDNLYREDLKKNLFSKVLYLIVFSFKSFVLKRKTKDINKSLVYFSTGETRHLQVLKKTITEDAKLNEEAIILDKTYLNDSIFSRLSFNSLLRAFSFTLSNLTKIKRCLKPLHLSFKWRLIFYVSMLQQIIYALLFRDFFKTQNTIKLVVLDYDRGIVSSALTAVTRAIGVNSVTLQHGVINPPVGYSPVNANEIWVWGEMAKSQLIAQGVKEVKIKVIGTPIIDELIPLKNEGKKKLREKYNLRKGLIVTLALSTPDKESDIKLVEFYSKLQNRFKVECDNYLVKIHPARDINNFKWIETDYNLKILPKDIDYSDFMKMVDVLLINSSGIATEALCYNKKLGVLDVLKRSPGNGIELNTYFNVPLIKEVDDYDLVLNQKLKHNKSFAFRAIGDTAKLNIRQQIKEILRNANY